MSKKKILVVDDEEYIRILYSEELVDEGYDVISASNGYRLLEKINAEKPNLVVLDIKMDGYNGLDLLQDIRKIFPDLPVILCSADSTYQDDVKSITADHYVIKSSDLTELKKWIATTLEKRYLQPKLSQKSTAGPKR